MNHVERAHVDAALSHKVRDLLRAFGVAPTPHHVPTDTMDAVLGATWVALSYVERATLTDALDPLGVP